MSKALAVIPARIGSKRIPKKNIRQFCGREMIAWVIEAARESGVFDAIIVSTDSTEVAEVAEKWGAEVPFLRSADLSGDKVPMMPVIADAIQRLEAMGRVFDDVCCLFPTSPLLSTGIIKEGYEVFKGSEHTFVFSIARSPIQIFRTFELSEEGRPKMFWPENQKLPSQMLPTAYYDAGKFYWGGRESFLSLTSVMLNERSFGFEVPWHMATDIDDLADWELAEILFKEFRMK